MKATYRAYLSEPITRCPVRERGRIQRLVGKLKTAISEPPYSTQLYIPSQVSDPLVRKHLTPEHVYLLDRIRIVEADYLLVLADHTSFGVGGEVEMATNLGKPIIIFSREKKLSRFLLGTPANAHLTHHDMEQAKNHAHTSYYIHYKEWRDLKAPLLKIISKITLGGEFISPQLPFWDVSTNLKQARREKGWTVEFLARKAGILLPQLILWEKSLDDIVSELQAYQKAGQLDLDPIELNSSQLELLTNPCLNALHKLTYALGLSMNDLLGDQTKKLLTKGPAKSNRKLKSQLIRSREEVLEQRAFQFDVTFREFRSLRKIFISDFIKKMDDSVSLQAINYERINEDDFNKELMILREQNYN